MFTIKLTGLNHDRPIMAIKALRALTGGGLKECKYAIDNLRYDGVPYTFTTDVPNALQVLDEGMLTYTATISGQRAADVRNVLSRMPQHLTVADVLAVLDAVS